MGQAEGVPATQGTRPALPKFIAPMLVLILAGCACVLVSALFKADNQMSQDLYAFEQDDMYNKHIVWNGNQWVDEHSGKPVSMRSQHVQTLLARQALTESLAEPAAMAPNYNCCYVPKVTGHNGGVSLLDSTQLVESGMFCHMMIKNKPSSEWPMIRMGSLREAGVTTDDNTGNTLLAKHELHHCRNDLIFKTQNFAVLASSRASVQMLSESK